MQNGSNKYCSTLVASTLNVCIIFRKCLKISTEKFFFFQKNIFFVKENSKIFWNLLGCSFLGPKVFFLKKKFYNEMMNLPWVINSIMRLSYMYHGKFLLVNNGLPSSHQILTLLIPLRLGGYHK